MKTKTSKTIIWLRSLIILPLLAILIYSFSNKAIIETENTTEQSVYQKKATQKEIAEYNRLAKKYNNPQGRVIIKNKEVERLNYIYRVMTVEQRKKAEPFPVFPPPPPVPGEPSKLRGVVEVPAPEPTPVKVVEVREVPAPVEVREVVEVPPPPPPPKSPLEHVKDMAKKGAKFYYNKKEISSKKAISILTKNKNISITTNHSNDNDYVVQLSTKPIVIKED